ncbi:hypothetical protein F3Y22_tig00110328pilonHSYRG00419 [Hibiscus syriacus]|uniref:Uncharacterized protein n=2 Tax=Hibiscus syriacus TaxID=106335 RepID=A0A6A3AYA8_HIBSY|nr:hypothetical protein F3Y22_tig00110328pilonHSYRG00419 [Hibiscus syriacus]
MFMVAADSQSLHGVRPPHPWLPPASISTAKASDALPLPLYLTNAEDEEEENEVLLCKEDARTVHCRQALDGSLPSLPSYAPNVTAQKLFDENPVRVTTEEDARKPCGQTVNCSFPSLLPRVPIATTRKLLDEKPAIFVFSCLSFKPLTSQIPIICNLQTMPRRSSGGRSVPRPAARAPANNAPLKPASYAPPPTPVQKGNGFGAAIVDGIGWGVGTVMAHRAADAIVGPRVIKHETVASSEPAASAAPAPNTNNLVNSDACGGQYKALSDSLTNYGSDISKCQFYMDILKE